MKNHAITSILAIIIIVTLAGCFAQQYVGSAVDKPSSLSGAAAEKKEFTVVKHFNITDRSGWFILGLIKSGHTNLNEILQNELKEAGGDAIMNVKIETMYDPLDIIITVLVGGIYNTRVSHIEGDVIKYK